MTSIQPEQVAGSPFDRRHHIPDEVTALQVGIAILTAYFGKELVARFEPYQAVLLDGQCRVGFERASGRCQRCRRPHPAQLRCLPDGRWFKHEAATWRNRPCRWPDLMEPAELRHTRIEP